ncbi:SMP-30/gluconolactonase/LRE family protein [Anatilimnocola floriformis]|uniref:SMP-30/gluconolactonase/LRE family protein n=1 Tax=Anatilimnocola floriformis TaxID=2948575 RepID=UPI0020C40CCD|nr:SMP-30/gluconolactonase/LRE family protein [Anatilimnocola floriformis]
MIRCSIAFVLATHIACSFAAAQDIPKGEVLKFSFENSKVFPGTYREYSVYIPKQYSPDKPACVHINQDGVQFNGPAVFDELIAKKEMPITIGVFITPGRVKALDGKIGLDRFNRSFEYDGLGDSYARFLLEELLPDVETKKASDGREIKLSKDGNDRCIAGSSSGAIAAFTAAWERPHEFRRVFSAIGTYVGLRGGNVYPTLVRKYEPKALRIFLEDGSADQNIYAGDWWMANQELERSLVFAGYEVNHSWGDGGHNGKHATEIYPDAIRWLWKDYPQPIKAGLGSPQLKEILIPGEDWKLVGEGYKFTEGPTANAKGEVFFNDIPNQRTHKIDADGKISVLLEGSERANGQAMGPNGNLYAIRMDAENIMQMNDKGEWSLVKSGFRCNDLVVLHNGSIYSTKPGWDGKSPSEIIYISPAGERQVVDSGLIFANGVTVSPDQTLLNVSDRSTHWVYSYQIQPDGSLANKQKYYHLHVPDTAEDSRADGMRCDQNGRLWVATNLGLQVCDQAGRVNCIIPTPNGKCSNLTFAGPKFDTVLATCGDKVYSRKVKVTGANAWQPPMKPAGPKL